MKKDFMKKALILVLTFAMIFTMAACGSTNEPAANGGNDGGSSAPANQVDRPDKQVVYPVDWPAYIDPGVGSKAADVIAFANLYEALTFPNNDGTVSACIATEWDSNDECTVYTFKLRDDVKFHSGNPVTAEDVKFSMDRMLTLGEGYAYLFAGIVESVEVIDDTTVQFNLASTCATLPEMLVRCYIVDSKLVMDNLADGSYGEYGDYGKAFLLTNDAGSGPYYCKEMKTEEYLIMEKFDGYWQEFDAAAPTSAKLMAATAASTMKTQIARGEIDLSDEAQTSETLESMAANEGIEIGSVLGGINFNVMLNTKIAPTDDVHFRKAMAYAIDYQTVCDNIYVGSVKATGPICRGLTASALSEAECPYNFDLEAAKAELEQSPYYDELTSGAMTVSLTYCSEGGEQQEKLALLVQACMSQLGVKVEITGKPFATMMTDAAEAQTTPNASFVTYAPGYLEGGGYIKARYHSSSAGSWEHMEWLDDPEIDAMIEDAMTTIDSAERNQKYKDISLKLIDMCPTIWLCDLASRYAYRADYVLSTPILEDQKNGVDSIYAAGYTLYFRSWKVA